MLRGLAIGLTLGALIMACVLGVIAAVSAVPPRHAISGPSSPRSLDRAVPAFGLRDARGRRTALTALRGRWLVFAPAMTSCREVCPLTTGALMELHRRLVAVGLGDRVTLAEVTVDPWRDHPARLRAYRRRAGVRGVRLLTGSRGQIRRLWAFFGVFFHRLGSGRCRDVEHTEALFIVDPRGRERWASAGMPKVGGRLPRRLRSLLDAQGRRDLARTGIPFTADRALAELRRLGVRGSS